MSKQDRSADQSGIGNLAWGGTSDEQQLSSQPTILLPRSAWSRQLTYLKVLFKAKQALDRAERSFRL
jgi:hypothetical protein